MLHFRKMKMEDLDVVYLDNELKSLLTVPPLGDKFGMLMEEDCIIRGGVTGYTKGYGAMVQMLKLKESDHNYQLAEGLLRAAIYMLDLENIKIVFSKVCDEELYSNVGFKKSKDFHDNLDYNIDKIILGDLSNEPFVFLDVDSFFNQPCCK